jgi:hypothetical protein
VARRDRDPAGPSGVLHGQEDRGRARHPDVEDVAAYAPQTGLRGGGQERTADARVAAQHDRRAAAAGRGGGAVGGGVGRHDLGGERLAHDPPDPRYADDESARTHGRAI